MSPVFVSPSLCWLEGGRKEGGRYVDRGGGESSLLSIVLTPIVFVNDRCLSVKAKGGVISSLSFITPYSLAPIGPRGLQISGGSAGCCPGVGQQEILAAYGALLTS